ncbi:tetratricopeptide repeat protein 12 isoform X2 [Triplophysa rosa]|uniref:Tetratricopeptide repeat protein 12 n=1 Tax=Triplophysa rosa TaxID=992332 RepID=A0A9W7TKE5_TRIRA|nr:tetratricopeptide repeat protein 12 isoform X2 [Triplophysa rosa]KAI7800503.1 putative tetratricopeptide repeat protein 12 [Triplophysa rosa]
MTLQDSNDFERFLRNVDQINELVKGLKSSDVSCQEEALEKADQLIASLELKEACKTKINKNVINTNPSSEIRPLSIQDDSSQNPENFMRLLEKDAEERRHRRKMNEDKADALREKGNVAFARGDYETAVRFYSEGLDQLRDVQTLYTNRAQAFIKLKRYKDAISDCEWALRCNGRCVKAYVHMGKSYLALKNFSESRICYQKILEIEPQRETMVKAYMTQVDTEEKAALQEQVAWEELRDGTEQATAIPELLKKLSRPNEINLYYCGGLELLSRAIKDCTGQTLFRLNNGFSVINGNNIVSSCRSQNLKEPCAVDLCVSVIKLWRTVCDGNEPNQLMLMECPDAREYIVPLLASPVHVIHWECLELLRIYSQTRHGWDLVINNLDLYRTAEALMGRIHRDTSSASALAVLESLAAENKFKIQSRENFIAIFVLPFEHLLSNIGTTNHETLASLISVIGRLALDDVIGVKLANRSEFWRCSLQATERQVGCEWRSVLYPLLGLMINVASHPCQVTQEHAVLASSRCLELLSDSQGGIITRAAGLLSVLLPTSRAATQEVVQNGIVKRLLKILKVRGEMSSRYSIKALAVCTASIPQACEKLVKLDKRLHTLRKLLGSIDEVVVGNAALCIGHCLGADEAASNLLGTDCVSLLLRHAAGDAKRTAVQQNAAITLGKLCKAEPRHMAKLRELHGLEILHSCVRLIT